VQAVEIVSVDGQPVGPDNFAARALIRGPTALSLMLFRPAAVHFCCEKA